MSNEITAEEFEEYQSILLEFQSFCRTIYTADHGAPLPEDAAPFSPNSVFSKRRIWNIARAAWLEFRDEDPDRLHSWCQDYLTSSRNPDPSSDYRDSKLND